MIESKTEINIIKFWDNRGTPEQMVAVLHHWEGWQTAIKEEIESSAKNCESSWANSRLISDEHRFTEK